MEKFAGFLGVVDTTGTMFVYKESPDLKNQIKSGKITEGYLFKKPIDNGMKRPEKGYNIYKLSIVID